MTADNRVALAVRIRNEWPLLEGLLESLAGTCHEAWVLDDASEEPIPSALTRLLPRVVTLRAEKSSGEGSKLGEGEQRDHLLQSIKRGSACSWILQLDADERLDRPAAVLELIEDARVDGWVLPLADYYIAPEDHALSDLVNPGRVRCWHGIETRWELCLFRATRWLYVSRGDVREPQGLAAKRVSRSSRCVVEHFGKSISVAEWERKADFYITHYPAYRDKWLARKGAAVHAGVSDFGSALLRRGDASFDPDQAPCIYEHAVDRGLRPAVKRVLYGFMAPSLRSVATTETVVDR